MIIDCHGHYTTAPKELEAFRQRQINGLKDPAQSPSEAPRITDDQIRASLENAQLKFQRERGTDLTIFSPRAMGMGHHIGNAATSLQWSRICNDLIYRVCSLYPENFAACVCQLLFSIVPGVPPANCIGELKRCVEELGFIGCTLNPDPSGGHWSDPPLTDRFWYPLSTKKMAELDIPAMIHVSGSCNPNFHATGAHYLNGDTTAFMQFLTSRHFQGFSHAEIHHSPRRRGGSLPLGPVSQESAQDLKRPPLGELLLKNVYFDTCVYHQAGIDLLTKVIPIDNILFASEMVGAVKSIDPETGYYFDDTKRYVEAVPWLHELTTNARFTKAMLEMYTAD